MLKSINKVWGLVFLVVLLLCTQIIAFNKSQEYSAEEVKTDDLSGQISFVSNRTDKRTELNELIEQFKEIHPEANVKLELIGDAEEILERKASVGDLPDVTLVPGTIDRKEFKNYFLPIDDLGFNSENMYDYTSGVGDDNSLYNLSTSILWQGVIYNKDIFDELGITRLPRTEEEFMNICSIIKENGIVPVALNYKQSWMMNMWVDVIPYLYDADMEKEFIYNSQNVMDSNSAIYKSLNFARQIYNNGYCEEDILNYDWQQCREDLCNKKTAMIIWNSDYINQLVDSGMDRNSLSMFPIPGTKYIKMNGDYRIGISRYTKYPELSKEFLKFLFEEDRYAKAVNIMSSVKNSEFTVQMIDKLRSFAVPIVYQEDLVLEQDEEDIAIHNKYTYLKKNIGLNYSFVQNYITTQDLEDLKGSTNSKWKNYSSN